MGGFNFYSVESFLLEWSPDNFAICAIKLLPMKSWFLGYLPFYREDSSIHMHGFCVYIRDKLSQLSSQFVSACNKYTRVLERAKSFAERMTHSIASNKFGFRDYLWFYNRVLNTCKVFLPTLPINMRCYYHLPIKLKSLPVHCT